MFWERYSCLIVMRLWQCPNRDNSVCHTAVSGPLLPRHYWFLQRHGKSTETCEIVAIARTSESAWRNFNRSNCMLTSATDDNWQTAFHKFGLNRWVLYVSLPLRRSQATPPGTGNDKLTSTVGLWKSSAVINRSGYFRCVTISRCRDVVAIITFRLMHKTFCFIGSQDKRRVARNHLQRLTSTGLGLFISLFSAFLLLAGLVRGRFT